MRFDPKKVGIPIALCFVLVQDFFEPCNSGAEGILSP